MKNKENKDKNRVSFKSMIIAMIVALLAFLGFGGFELGNGEGADVDTGDKSGVESMVDANEDNSENDADISSYTIYVRDDVYFVEEDSTKELIEVTLDEIEEAFALLSEDTMIIIFDDAALEKPYSDLMKLVDESGLRFSEDTVTK